MTLPSRWESLRESSVMQDRINRLFPESYNPEGTEDALTTTIFAPPVGIYQDAPNIARSLNSSASTKRTTKRTLMSASTATISVGGEEVLEAKTPNKAA